ncbi:MAG: hypothetical protein C5B51_14715 [Terriglobia bacterium]|nr:MAG: hypothetical protein C5B51_14715 [Terriglobia bacterium]
MPPTVPYQPLPNYLRTYRRRAGFSQDEVALLLGATSGTKVSRYENFSRIPSVRAVFGYQAIFRVPSSELFAGAYQDVQRQVIVRAGQLIKILDETADDAITSRKIALLRSIVEGEMDVHEPLP